MSPKFTIVPYQKLSKEALSGLIDEFILREGTDYGKNEQTLETKHSQIMKQLIGEHVVIVFDTQEQTASILKKELVK